MSRNFQIFKDAGLTDREMDIFTDQDSHVVQNALEVGQKWSRVRDITPGNSEETIVYLENYEMADQAGWPAPWVTQHLSGTGGSASIETNRGVLTVDSASRMAATHPDLIVSNFIYRVNFRVSQTPTPLQTNFQFRGQGEWESPSFSTSWRKRGYWVWLDDTKIYFGKTQTDLVNNIIASEDIPFTYQADEDVLLEVVANQNNFDVYFWQDGQTKPATPTLTVTDDSYSEGVIDFLAASTASALDGEKLMINSVQISVPEQQVQIENITPQDSQVTIQRSSVLVRDSYVVRHKPAGGVYGEPVNVGLTNPFVVGGLTNGQEYVFQVAEVNNDIIGNWSDEVTATPSAGEITSLSFDQTSPEVDIGGTRRLSVTYVIASGTPSKDTTFTITSGATGVTINKVADTEVDVITDQSAVAESTVTIEAKSIFDETKTDSIIVTVKEPANIPDSEDDDLLALKALYEATDGDNWHNNSGWDTSWTTLPTNSWHGITVRTVDGQTRVDRIHLNDDGSDTQFGNNMVGELPEELANLRKMRYFNVRGNRLTGTLKAIWRHWDSIEHVYFEGARTNSAINPGGGGDVSLTGALGKHPGKWSNKAHPQNGFTGHLPAEWADWGDTIISFECADTIIDDNGNGTREGISGILPPEWQTWTKVHALLVSNNAIEGGLPDEWKFMVRLRKFHCPRNRLGDPTGGPDSLLPPSWGGQPGETTWGIRRMTELRINWLGDTSGKSTPDWPYSNQFRGTFPDEWKNMRMLHHIDAAGCGFDGDFPVWFGNGDFHQRKWLSSEWQGDEPDPDAEPVEAYSLGISTFEFRNNNFSVDTNQGDDGFPNLNNLTRLSVFSTRSTPFNTDIPQSIGGISRVQQIDIASCGLTGSWPSLTGLWNLRFINAEGNNFSGPLPDINTGISNFRSIVMRGGSITGSIPLSWANISSSSWRKYDLRDNNMSGHLPVELAQLANEQNFPNAGATFGTPAIDLRGNNFSQGDFADLKAELENMGLSQSEIDDFIQI